MGNRLDADVPRLAVNVVRVGIVADETGRLIDLVRERRGHQDLREQGIRVERDWSEQVVELVRRERLIDCVVLGQERRGQGHQRESERNSQILPHGVRPLTFWLSC